MAKKTELKVVSSDPVELENNDKTVQVTQPKEESTKEEEATTKEEETLTKDEETNSTKEDKIDTKTPEKTEKIGDDKKELKESIEETKDKKSIESTNEEKDSSIPTQSKKDELESVPIDETPTSSTDNKPTNEDNLENDEKLPTPPPRPVSPFSQISKTLKEAFPTIEDKLITAVIIASQGNLDPAFNALLYISDSSYKPEINLSINSLPPPSHPSSKVRNGKSNKSVTNNDNEGSGIITDDELLARQLQKEFEKEDEKRRRKHESKQQRRQYQTENNNKFGGNHNDNADSDESPDEFEQIKETFTQGIEEARSTLNGWVSGLSKKFTLNEQQQQQQRDQQRDQQPKLFGALGGSSFKGNSNSNYRQSVSYNQQNNKNSNTRKSNNFDEDPPILSNNFHQGINLSNNDINEDVNDKPNLPTRPNHELHDDKKQWQPLNSDIPINSDAFLVTDSEDEDNGVNSYGTRK